MRSEHCLRTLPAFPEVYRFRPQRHGAHAPWQFGVEVRFGVKVRLFGTLQRTKSWPDSLSFIQSGNRLPNHSQKYHCAKVSEITKSFSWSKI